MYLFEEYKLLNNIYSLQTILNTSILYKSSHTI